MSQTCSLSTKLYCFFSKSEIWYTFSCHYTSAAKHVNTGRGKQNKNDSKIWVSKAQPCVKILASYIERWYLNLLSVINSLVCYQCSIGVGMAGIFKTATLSTSLLRSIVGWLSTVNCLVLWRRSIFLTFPRHCLSVSWADVLLCDLPGCL